jgi:hypothetical protein
LCSAKANTFNLGDFRRSNPEGDFRWLQLEQVFGIITALKCGKVFPKVLKWEMLDNIVLTEEGSKL